MKGNWLSGLVFVFIAGSKSASNVTEDGDGWRLGHQFSDDNRQSEGLEALTEYLPTTDPFTRQVLKDPYVNRKCGHVYEYESVCSLILGGKIK